MKFVILFLCFTSSLCDKWFEDKFSSCVNGNNVPSPRHSASEVVLYTQWILELLDSSKDEFIQKLQHGESFAKFLETELGQKEWLRKFEWYTDGILPKEKVLGQQLSDHFMQTLLESTRGADDVISKIRAALKFINTSMYFLLFHTPENDNLFREDADLGITVSESYRIINSIICSIENYMDSKNLARLDVREELESNINDGYGGFVLRDLINCLEYIKQLFIFLPVDQVDIVVSYDG